MGVDSNLGGRKGGKDGIWFPLKTHFKILKEKISNRLIDRRANGVIQPIVANDVIFVADIRENEGDPAFPTLRCTQVKSNEVIVNIQSQITQQGKRLWRS